MGKMILIDEDKIKKALDALESYEGFIDEAHIIEAQWHWIDGAKEAAPILRHALEQQLTPPEPMPEVINGVRNAVKNILERQAELRENNNEVSENKPKKPGLK